MQDFLEVLLYIIIGFWVMRLVLRWALPHLLRYFVQHASKKAESQFHTRKQDTNAQNNSYQKNKKKMSNEKVGEYIDFEEID